MKKFALFILLLIIVAGVGVVWLDVFGIQKYRGYSGAEQFVDIPPGSSSRAIGERLVSSGVVKDHLTFRMALWMSGRGRHLKAGEYRFDAAVSPMEVIQKIAEGDVFVIPVTFPEGLTVAEMASIFASHNLGPAAAFVAASKNAALIAPLDPAARDLEGYLFPETYPLTRHTDAATLVRLMADRFTHVFTPEMRDAAVARGLDVRRTITLASIVEKETARPDERPLVASVYLNRLRIGMPLQCDPTVIYALTKAGKYAGNLTRENLAFDSPYNTYRYPGLPPGPIASPGKASIDAVVHPADSEYLYFVSRNDGSHVFAKTLDEHNRNVQKYQVQYFREKRQAGGMEAPAARARRASLRAPQRERAGVGPREHRRKIDGKGRR
jgi:UPF0755 protein